MGSSPIRSANREKMKTLFRIEAPHFTAGILIYDETVTDTAPIVSYMKGWDLNRVLSYVKKKQWIIAELRSKQDYS